MLFNSKEFIAVVLPVSLGVYYALAQTNLPRAAKVWLLVVSLFVYFCWDPVNWPLLIFSIGMNYFISWMLRTRSPSQGSRAWLVAGIVLNVGLLGFFKYADFLIQNANAVIGSSWTTLHVALPLGISFYTFVQLAYLSDCYEGLTTDEGFLDYAVFVAFFPKIVSGPIVRQKELVPQLADGGNLKFNYNNFGAGVFLFLIGLSKKVVLADNLAGLANAGFSSSTPLNFIAAWVTSVSFTLEVYFDFSGYTDMALGLGLMFNLILPNNFNSPLRATSIINFWQRWHMTLTRFLTTYVFSAILRTFGTTAYPLFAAATIATMLVSGLWHGASWLFVVFGLLHGIALVVNHLWRRRRLPMPAMLGWCLTFTLVSVSNVFFRADSWESALGVVRGMAGMQGVMPVASLDGVVPFTEHPFFALAAIGALMFMCLTARNSVQSLSILQKPSYVTIVYVVALFYAIVLFGHLDTRTYVYFQF